ncbi:hypothetical protein [uncultured Methylobacterium sp.]|uniref:hypothetical protein n=1 Tax=uncultured Methylobacterium sp. TaxID=157278 RepID=UPI0035CA5522
MDVSTAKTLVSALLVSAIFLFTIASLRMFVSELVGDLRGAAPRHVGGPNDRAE